MSRSRDYNIINFAPSNPTSTKHSHNHSEPLLPRIAPSTTTSKLDKNFSTIALCDHPDNRNKYPFENVVNHIRHNKRFDPLMQSKITNETKYDKGVKPTLFNASRYDYDFITFAKRKNPETYDSISKTSSQATFKKSAVSEFWHIGRVTAPNFNNNHRDIMGRDQGAFRIKNGMGGAYLDSKRTYGEIANCFKRSGK